MRNISKEDFETPFDIITLPSQGMFYADKRAQLMVRYLTTREELVMTQPSLAESGLALDMVLGAVIMDDVKIEDLLVADRDAVILYLRSTSYGDKITLHTQCSECSKTGETSFSLSELEIKDPRDLPDSEGCFRFRLPKMKIGPERKNVVLRFRPLTVKDERRMHHIIRYMSEDPRYSKSITGKYRAQIKDINGNTDSVFIDEVIRNMPISDSLALRKYMDVVEPGINSNVNFTCKYCTASYSEDVYIGPDFLKLPPEHRQAIKEEMFLVRYYGKGVTYQDAMNMCVTDRKWEIDRISKEIDKKNEAEKKAVEDAKKKSK